MSEELPDETEINPTPYGSSVFGPGEELPAPTDEEKIEIENVKGYSPKPEEI